MLLLTGRRLRDFYSQLLVLLVLVSGAVCQLPPTRARLGPLFPGSLWRRNVSSLPASSSSFLQVQAAFAALKGSTVGVPSPVPLLPGPPSVLVHLVSGLNPPLAWARHNASLAVPQMTYAGVVSGAVLSVPQPEFPLVQPSLLFGALVLVSNNGTETDLFQVTNFKVLGYSQGGGYIGPILAAAALATFDMNGVGSGDSAILPSGVPLLGGTLLPEDLDRGIIDHVLAVTWPQFRNQNQYYSQSTDIWPSDYYPPCTGSEYTGSSWRQMALAAGQVLRLKPNGTLVFYNNSVIDESIFAPVTKMVIAAFRTYGVMPVRLGPSMSIVVESVNTGFVSMSFAEAQRLVGSKYQLVIADGRGLWYQLLQVIAQEIALIPLASPAPRTQNVEVNFLIPDANLLDINIQTPNWEVVVGGPGSANIGEGFIPGYNYLGSIDVILIILACTVALPLATVFALMIANGN